MSYFIQNTKKRKKSSMLKWAIYAAVLLLMIFVFIPRFLIYKAGNILDKEIPEGKQVADSFPPRDVFVAYNFLQVAKFFPLGEDKANEGQKQILDFYFPLFKDDYNKLKFACVDNAISEIKKQNPGISADSASMMALGGGWREHPDPQALSEFRSHWDTYHKNYAHSLPEYPRFIDAGHL